MKSVAAFAIGLCALPVVAFAAPADPLPPGEGRDVTIRVCGKCHDPAEFADQDLDAEGWKQMVQEMANSGAEGSEADFAAISAYLAKAFPEKSKQGEPK